MNLKHSETKNGRTSKEWLAWRSMRDRCYRKTSPQFKDYGGRGITVCNSWKKSYVSFLQDMGRAPSPLHSLDRIDNNAGYYAGNCRWATKSEQALNRRAVDKLTDLFEKQRFLMKKLGVPFANTPAEFVDNEAVLTSTFKEYAMALIVELTETLQELNWKPWKKTKKPLEWSKIHEEMIDIWHFLLELSIIVGLDSSKIHTVYLVKNQENLARQKKGY